jgi:glutathione S-transferase
MNSSTSAPTRPAHPIKLHRFALSGHSHRVELFLSLLGIPVETLDVDLAGGEHKRAPFLALNPFGQVPVIEDGGDVVADSNAILVYLARRYAPASWLPGDPAAAARVQRYLSVAAGELAITAARARLVHVFGIQADVGAAVAGAHRLFGVLEHELAGGAFIAGPQPTIADVALYSYTAHAPEGGVSLAEYPNVRAWLARVEALPGFIPMKASPLPAAS